MTFRAAGAKRKTTMAKTPIHFIGFLANTDPSVKGLRMGERYTVEYRSNDYITPFLRMLDSHYGFETAMGVLSRSSCCVIGTDIAQFEATPQGGVAIRPSVLTEVHKFVQDKCRLLRLFKEGNIVLAYSFLYHLSDTNEEPKPFAFAREYPIVDTTKLALTPSEFFEAESFIQTVSLPLAEPSLDLALESLEQSYEVQDTRLAFLSLMIGMEATLGPEGATTEITRQISRNAAVLLGATPSESDEIFARLKTLYAKRSKIVHGVTPTKHKDRLQREDLFILRHYLRTTIKILRTVSESREETLARLNRCAFGSRPFTPPTVR